MKINRRTLIGKTLQSIAAIELQTLLPGIAVDEARKVANTSSESASEKNVLIANLISGVEQRKEQEAYLRAYLQNPQNTSGGLPGQNYIAARMVDGKPELQYFYTPAGMLLAFQFFEEPRAIKYLKNWHL